MVVYLLFEKRETLVIEYLDVWVRVIIYLYVWKIWISNKVRSICFVKERIFIVLLVLYRLN